MTEYDMNLKELKTEISKGFAELAKAWKKKMEEYNSVKVTSNNEQSTESELTKAWKKKMDTMKSNEQSVENGSEYNLNLCPPWIIYFQKLDALFGKDPDIHIGFDEHDDCKINIRVDRPSKAEALRQLLPSEVFFGNVKVTVCVIPANAMNRGRINLIAAAFEGNPIYDGVVNYDQTTPMMGDNYYVMFKKKVAQFYGDNLGDPNGNMSFLYRDLAEEILGHAEFDHIYYSTSEEE